MIYILYQWGYLPLHSTDIIHMVLFINQPTIFILNIKGCSKLCSLCLWDNVCGYFQINYAILNTGIESQGLSGLLISNSELDLDIMGATDISSLTIWRKIPKKQFVLK